MQAEKLWAEEIRKFSGLVIVITVSILNYAYPQKSNS
jgi:hypothetical protein